VCLTIDLKENKIKQLVTEPILHGEIPIKHMTLYTSIIGYDKISMALLYRQFSTAPYRLKLPEKNLDKMNVELVTWRNIHKDFEASNDWHFSMAYDNLMLNSFKGE
jgi:hypothetical protein